MQISATRHSSRVSIGRTAGFGYSFTGSELNRDTSCTRVSGGGVGTEPGKGASETGTLAAEMPATTKAVSGGSGSAVAALPTDMAAGATAGSGSLRWDTSTAATKAIALASGASTAPGASVLNDVAPRVAPPSPIGVGVFSMPDAPKTPSLAAPQSVRATVPHNTAKARNCRGLITDPL